MIKTWLIAIVLLALISPLPARGQNGSLWQPITPNNVTQAQLLTTLHFSKVDDFVWSADGHLLAVADATQVNLYDTNNLTLPPHVLDVPGVISMAFSPDGTTLALGSQGYYSVPSLSLWNLLRGEEVRVLTSDSDQMRAVDIAFSPDGRFIASQHFFWLPSGLLDPSVRLWGAQTGTLIAKVEGGGYHVVFSPDSRLLAADTQNNTVRVWEIARLQSTPPGSLVLEQLALNGSNPLGFSSDGRLLIYLGHDGGRVWDMQQNTMVARPDSQHLDLLQQFLEPDNPLAILEDNQAHTLQIRDVVTEKEITEFPTGTGNTLSSKFNPQRTLLASSSDDGTIRLWGIPAP